jgi:hypothetical protein
MKLRRCAAPELPDLDERSSSGSEWETESEGASEAVVGLAAIAEEHSGGSERETEDPGEEAKEQQPFGQCGEFRACPWGRQGLALLWMSGSVRGSNCAAATARALAAPRSYSPPMKPNHKTPTLLPHNQTSTLQQPQKTGERALD